MASAYLNGEIKVFRLQVELRLSPALTVGPYMLDSRAIIGVPWGWCRATAGGGDRPAVGRRSHGASVECLREQGSDRPEWERRCSVVGSKKPQGPNLPVTDQLAGRQDHRAGTVLSPLPSRFPSPSFKSCCRFSYQCHQALPTQCWRHRMKKAISCLNKFTVWLGR